MLHSTTIMLYVNDVTTSAEFWEKGFNITRKETLDLPDNYLSVILELQPALQLQLFDKEFIKKYSPEVLNNTPSLLFATESLDQLHASLKMVSPMVSDISEETGTRQFYFSDNNDYFFAVTEEKAR